MPNRAIVSSKVRQFTGKTSYSLGARGVPASRSQTLTFFNFPDFFLENYAFYEKVLKDIFFIKWREEYEHIFCFEKKSENFPNFPVN